MTNCSVAPAHFSFVWVACEVTFGTVFVCGPVLAFVLVLATATTTMVPVVAVAEAFFAAAAWMKTTMMIFSSTPPAAWGSPSSSCHRHHTPVRAVLQFPSQLHYHRQLHRAPWSSAPFLPRRPPYRFHPYSVRLRLQLHPIWIRRRRDSHASMTSRTWHAATCACDLLRPKDCCCCHHYHRRCHFWTNGGPNFPRVVWKAGPPCWACSCTVGMNSCWWTWCETAASCRAHRHGVTIGA
mmetsp:Transcript_24498/g.68757  ORF Transcript_24498/g.68757 Transcript_24498/m.68757 type:complete len:238 (+) Transcript_24498:367-1080(+)